MSNAREFLDEIAAVLQDKGRPVEVTESTHDFGTFVWLQATAPNWYDRSISLSAAKSNRTGRWSLGELKVGPGLAGKEFIRKDRTGIRIAAEVFA